MSVACSEVRYEDVKDEQRQGHTTEMWKDKQLSSIPGILGVARLESATTATEHVLVDRHDGRAHLS